MRHAAMYLLLLFLFGIVVPAARSEGTAASQYAAAVNLAGRQRMLSQKAAKEALQIALAIEVDRSKESLKATIALFEGTLAALEKGDANLGLAPATAPALKEIATARPNWVAFKSALQAALDGKTDVHKIAETNIEVLRDMQALVRILEDESHVSTGTVWGTVINLAGRQRMFSQKMSKELFLVALDKDAETHRAALKQTAGLFDRTLKGLIGGDAGLKLPPSTDTGVKKQIEVVAQVWADFQPIVERAVAGGTPGADDLKRVAELNLTLLTECDQATKMFEALASGK